MQTISLAADQVGPDLLPLEELADCAETALGRDGATILSYGAGAGYTPLRELIGEWFDVHPSRIVLTNGRLHALALLARRATGRGVIAEYPIHDRAERVFLQAGASLISVPVAENGLVLDELRSTLGQYVRPAIVYVIPSFHNPTGWTTPPEGRKGIVEVVLSQNALQTEQILLVEDDTYGLTRFEGDMQPALFNYSDGKSVYTSSFSASIAPGLRVGFVIAPDWLASELAAWATDTYITPSLLSQATVYEFTTRESFPAHLERLRDGLRTRRDAMLSALEKHFVGATWSRPEGGLFTWLQLPGYPDGREVLARAEGVTAVDGTKFAAMSSALRLSFGFASPDEIEFGVHRLSLAL